MFYKIEDSELIAELNRRKNIVNIKKMDTQPRGEYLLTYSLNGEPVKVMLTCINNKNYTILYKLRSREYFILQLRFHSNLFQQDIELYGDLMDNTLYIHCAYIRSGTLIDNIQELDQLLFTSYKEDLDMENLRICIKEFSGTKRDILNRQDPKINGILYLNNYIDKQHYIEFIRNHN